MNPQAPFSRAADALRALMELAATLRGPEGCPWDRKQTSQSAAKYLLEEASEALDAILFQGPEEVKDELGDVLFQVVFQAQLYAERGEFDLYEVIEHNRAKMIRRHPHVFGENKVKNAEEVPGLWREVKARERKTEPDSLLDGVPRSLPSLSRAMKLGKKAAEVGFDWEGSAEVPRKVAEEVSELERAAGGDATGEELGDLLFSLAQWARHKGLDPELALRRANQKFSRRFREMEGLAAKRGLTLSDMDLEKLDNLWEQVKSETG